MLSIYFYVRRKWKSIRVKAMKIPHRNVFLNRTDFITSTSESIINIYKRASINNVRAWDLANHSTLISIAINEKLPSRFLRWMIKVRRDRANYYFSLREYYFCNSVPLVGINETFTTVQCDSVKEALATLTNIMINTGNRTGDFKVYRSRCYIFNRFLSNSSR